MKRAKKVEPALLPAVRWIEVQLDDRDPLAYFQSREGFEVGDGFKQFILPAVTERHDLMAVTIGSSDLCQHTDAVRVRQQLPEGHIFLDADHFCRMLAALIKDPHQDLLSTQPKRINFAFVQGVGGAVFAVNVVNYCGWRCHAFEPWYNQDLKRPTVWAEGDRVFSAMAVKAA